MIEEKTKKSEAVYDDEDDLNAPRTKPKSPGKFIRWARRHIRFVLSMVLVVIVLVFAAFFAYYKTDRQSLMDQLEQTQSDLERQQVLLNAYQEKLQETEEVVEEPAPVVTSETIQKEISSLAELVTQEYNYRNADQSEEEERWKNGWKKPFSGKRLLVSYDGTIKAGIDFSGIRIDVDEAEKSVTITIPKATITDNIIPQDSIVVLEAKNGLFNEITFDDYNEFISDQKIVMEQKAIDQGLLVKADEEARSLITEFVENIPGIEAYTVTVQ